MKFDEHISSMNKWNLDMSQIASPMASLGSIRTDGDLNQQECGIQTALLYILSA